MEALYRVVYCSRTHLPEARDLVSGNIHQILQASRRNNARVGITGGLLFSEGCFAQVLEGPIDLVTETFERIQCDERHRDVTVLEAGPARSRQFPSWSMGFAGVDPARDPLVGAGLTQALTSQGLGGQEMLTMLKALIVREDDRFQLA